MKSDREKAIEVRAYHLWEASGHPHGMHDEHWRQAEREIDQGLEVAGTDQAGGGEVRDNPTLNVTSLSHRGTDARTDTPRRRT